ncbi:MAG: xylan 1,4-beta-xylosidase [Ginsengibacter sp.]
MNWKFIGKKLFFLAFIVTSTIVKAQLLYQNPNLSSEQRAKDLVNRLTLQEKAELMLDQSPAIPRLRIKKFNWWSEALHGLANNDNVTVFPEPIGMAASFNDSLVQQVFDAVSDEVRAKYNDAMRKGEENRRFLSLSVWTPNINLFRDPRWGRGQETYGEDPYLTSRMGIAVVKGLQGPANSKYRKLLACAKHFAVHSGPEWSRHQLNLNNVRPEDLWQTYLPAFKAVVQKGDVREVMCAYQRLDDEPCCGNTRLLQTILRDDWGFKYMVVSDCGAVSDFYTSHKVSSDAVHAAAKAALAGTDVECGYNYAFKEIPDAVKRGLINEVEVDKHLMRLLEGRFDVGEMDNDSLVKWTKIPMSVVNSPGHQNLALDMARQSLTLLQNKGNILPLSKSIKKIAVIGPNADNKEMMWGNYNGTPVNTITILDGIRSALSTKKVFYISGCDIVDTMVIENAFGQCSIDGKTGLKAMYWNNRNFKGEPVIIQQISRPLQLTTFGQHEFAPGVHLDDFSAIYQTNFKPVEPGEIAFNTEACGAFELVVNGDTIGRSRMWRALPHKFTYKVEKGKEYKIEARFRQIDNWTASLGLNFGKEVPVEYKSLVEKLKGIDEVIFVGGISPRLEGEEMPVLLPGFKGGDRTNIELPEVQRNCLKALKEAGKKIIFINCSGSAIGMVPETETCDAILQAWYSGEQGGRAVADVLFGNYNPSGKLPITLYKNIDQLPGFEDYSMKGRTYRYMSDPLFPFGYGLTYTSFSIGDAKPNKTAVEKGEDVRLTIPVSNIGKRSGTEVVQVYIKRTGDTSGILKTLKGFERIDLPAEKTRKAVIDLPYNSFEFYDDKTLQMNVIPGEYEVWYGSSSDVKDLKLLKLQVY